MIRKPVDIFRLTSRPDISLFYKNDDPKDLRLGSLVKSNPLNYEDSKFVLVGCPQDVGILRNNGIPGAAKAPDSIRRALYRLAYPRELETQGFFDLGNVINESELEATHEKLYLVVKKLLDDNKLVIIIGGGSDITYADVKAMKEHREDLHVVSINSKYHVSNSDQIHNESTYRKLLDEGILQSSELTYMGIQLAANSHIYHSFLKDRNVNIIYQQDIARTALREILHNINLRAQNRSILWAFDMNAVRTADAPGVKSITPTGLTSEEAVDIANYAGMLPDSKVLEITEVNPELDVNEITAQLAGMMILYFVSGKVMK